MSSAPGFLVEAVWVRWLNWGAPRCSALCRCLGVQTSRASRRCRQQVGCDWRRAVVSGLMTRTVVAHGPAAYILLFSTSMTLRLTVSMREAGWPSGM